jgi:hypothetical protein
MDDEEQWLGADVDADSCGGRSQDFPVLNQSSTNSRKRM